VGVHCEVKSPAAVATFSFGGTSAVVVRVPGFRVTGSITPQCHLGDAVVDFVKLPDGETPFDKIRDSEIRLLNRQSILAIKNGQERIGAGRLKVSNIAVEVQLGVMRKLNAFPTGGAKGPNGRPLATPQYRVRARSVILYDWAGVHEMQVRKGTTAQWTTERSGGADTEREEGPWGPVEHLHDAVCPPFEPGAGARYNEFVTIQIGKLFRKVTLK
jgi:hypothetical protein